MNKKQLFFLFSFVLLLWFVQPSIVMASCVPSQNGTVFTVGSDCAFSGTVDGVDAGEGTTNTATLQVSGATLTIGNNQSISVGSFEAVNGGKIIIPEGGLIYINKPLWMTDADGDGYPAITTKILSATQPANGLRVSALAYPTVQDSNDSEKCAAADTPSIVGSALYSTTCKKCVTGALADQTASEDLYDQCAASVNCNGSGACACSADGAVCTENSDCCTGSCTSFYQDSDSDLYGNASVTTKRCGTAYAGYVTNSTDANDSQRCADADTLLTVESALYGTTCQKCTSGALANQTNSEDVYSQCPGTVSCNGSGACTCTTDGVCTIAANTDINAASCVGRANADAVNFSTTSNISAGATTITLTTTPTGLAVGDEILIINLRGANANFANVGKYETRIITAINSDTKTLTVHAGLTNAYDGTTQKIMVQRVPTYTSVTVNASRTMSATAWNGTKNGVLMFRSEGAVTVNGAISMDGKGYRGGAQSYCTYQYGGGNGAESRCGVGGAGRVSWTSAATTGAGGGGGNLAPSGDAIVRDGANGICGGGGGTVHGYTRGTGSASYGGAGGAGGYSGAGGGGGYGTFGYGGQGGIDTTNGVTGGNGSTNASGNGGSGGGGGGTYGAAALTTLYFGSGGASGSCHYQYTTGSAGGIGGGIVYITAGSFSLSGTVSAAGNAGTACTDVNTCTGTGGGGAGGSVYLFGYGVTAVGTSKVLAGGGAGGTSACGTCTGGAGGSGRIAVYYGTSVSGTTTPTATTGVKTHTSVCSPE